MWQDYLAVRDIKRFETEPAVVDDIVSLWKPMGLDVESDDVKELIEDHRNELTI